MKTKEIIKKIVLMVIILYVFLLSINLMGASFKLFGNGFAETLISFTTNPFVGLFIGILATSIVQSSSVTTSLTVGLVAAGGLSVGTAIPIVMGANIGTSITNTIVSMGHITRKAEFKKAFSAAIVHDFFNILAVIILFPLELFTHLIEKSAVLLTGLFIGSQTVGFTSPLKMILKPVTLIIKDLLAGNAYMILALALVLIFLSLRYFVKIARPLAQTEFNSLLQKHLFKNPVRGFTCGLLLTAFVQSSSVTTSLIVPLVGLGILTLEKIFPYTLGANVGTTITAVLAALATNSPAALTVAFAHLMFNIFGIITIYPIRRIPFALSNFVADLSYKSRIYPIAYIASTFYLLPSAVVFFVH
ncbi:MAG: Na/Pi symporter [Nanoarchaeota archaeon]|nr:Na/Pi symporter [Nanoarchaeota archaeon]MCG2719068.1 Na/Pi symporter [Nanoarchaeota archaeon]